MLLSASALYINEIENYVTSHSVLDNCISNRIAPGLLCEN